MPSGKASGKIWPMSQELDALLDEVKGGAMVVFDLDDTLFLTANRNLRILREFAEHIADRDASSAQLLASVPKNRLRYAITDTARDLGLSESLIGDLKPFWFTRFFTNPYLLEDEAVPGGADYVRAVMERGGMPVFMTGRDEGMREGTVENMKRRGFPVPDEKHARLVLKPRFDTPDHEFKLEAMGRLKSLGAVVGTFENEPAHVNLFAEQFPSARHFLLETKHSGKPVVPFPGTIRIRDFARVAAASKA